MDENKTLFMRRIKEMARGAKYELLDSTAELRSMVHNDRLWNIW